ncbi:MAG: MBL fold metallo-hydrolase [Cryobacterium sp.]|nr:MBL fold metallo-hydrolase [Oligoflexia bacterium]
MVGPFQCNCKIIVCPVTGESAIIDAGDESEKIIAALEKIEWKSADGKSLKPNVRFLLHTHAHLDHIGGTRGVSEWVSKKEKAAPARALHRGDLFIYEKLQEQGSRFGFTYEPPLPIDHFLEHEERLEIGKLRFSVIHTPGHSPGGVGFRLHEDTSLGVRETVYSGDTLFQGSVGRTDLWGADADLMFKMIKERFLTLDGDTRVCPGHGPETQIGIEKRVNPYVGNQR